MPEHAELIRLVRAIAVLDGIGVRATRAGLQPDGSALAPPIGWEQVRAALAGDDPLDPAPRRRLALTVALHRIVVAFGDQAARQLARRSRLLALPVGHPLHLGARWAMQPVAGGVLELGVGVVELLPGQAAPLPLPPAIAELAGHDVSTQWARLLEHAENLGGIVGRHLTMTGNSVVLRSMGGCDALTLATTVALRNHLLGSTDATGSGRSTGWIDSSRGSQGVPIAAPRRDRVWTGDQAADRDRTRAVWLLTCDSERGVLQPLRLSGAGVEPVRRPSRPRVAARDHRSGSCCTDPCLRA
jgi:hypothetical protein